MVQLRELSCNSEGKRDEAKSSLETTVERVETFIDATRATASRRFLFCVAMQACWEC